MAPIMRIVLQPRRKPSSLPQLSARTRQFHRSILSSTQSMSSRKKSHKGSEA